MNIGFVPPGGEPAASMAHVRQTTAAALTSRHDVRTYLREHAAASAAERGERLREWVSSCDALIGPLDDELLRARQALDRCVPWAVFVLGAMPRGAPRFQAQHRLLHTRDVLICTSTADAALAAKFFPNAVVRVVPFAFDETRFYRTDAAVRAATRTRLGMGLDDKVLMYSGRLSLEKNIHTLLKTFKIVRGAVPEARLVLAGGELDVPFRELGIYPVNLQRSIKRLLAQLGLDDRSVLFVGQRTPDELRELYAAADVLVNLTLHHDENFGYAQVEAMACGVPAVGTAWGGLKDTIADGVTGAHVPAIVTSAGVKVDWWSAASSIVRLLRSAEREPTMRQRCADVARARYSGERYACELDQVLVECVANTCPCEPLSTSAFAEEYWATCSLNPDQPPPYRRGAAAFRLYRELITPYASSPMSPGADQADDAWVLAAPLSIQPGSRIAVNDPICPLEIVAPPHLAESVVALSGRFADRPVLPAVELKDSGPAVLEALAWMNDAGLVLRTTLDGLDPRCVPAVLGQPSFDMRAIDSRADFVWLC